MRRGEFFGSSAISAAESLTGDDFLHEVSFVASSTTLPGTCRACPVVSQDLDHPAMSELVSENLMRRRKSLIFKLDVAASRGAVLTDNEIERLFEIPNAGRPHIARILVEKGLARNVPEAFERYLSKMPKNADQMYVSPNYAVSRIHQANGIAIWAHPIGGEGEKRLSEDEFARTCSIMTDAGIDGCECFYSRYNLDEIRKLYTVADEFGWLKSGGSDYHGSNKTVELGTLCSQKEPSLKISSRQATVLQLLLSDICVDFL